MATWFHSPLVRRSVRALHLSAIARRAAYIAVTRGHGFIRVTKCGLVATFVTPTPETWRAVGKIIAAERLLESLLAQIRDSDVVYDVGAHYRVYSVLAARRGARVFAFEPNPACHSLFLANVAVNRLQSAITLARVALGDTAGTMTLHQGESVGMLDAVAVDAGQGSAVPVSLVRADVYSNRQGWPTPTVLKIDVKGYESAVLDGFGELLSDVRVVLCEVHPRQLLPNETPKGILRRITDAGLMVDASRRYHNVQYVLAIRR
jgi:FkbM family methyltransferase